jgi:hypothetical protein
MSSTRSRGASRRAQELLAAIKQLTVDELDRFADLIAKDESLLGSILEKSESFQRLIEAIRKRGDKSEELTKGIGSQVQAIIDIIELMAVRRETKTSLSAAVGEICDVADKAVKLIWELGRKNRELTAAYEHMIPKARFEERDDDIEQLRDEILPNGRRRTFGQVLQIVIKKWPTTQTGDPLTRDAVISAYKRRKGNK